MGVVVVALVFKALDGAAGAFVCVIFLIIIVTVLVDLILVVALTWEGGSRTRLI